MAKARIFADTNVIIESFRTGCWTAITAHFDIETVEMCVEETLTGNPNDSRHVAVQPAALTDALAKRHNVTHKNIAELVAGRPSCVTLDDGEKHLFAWLLANEKLASNTILVTTADKAALIACKDLGWLDCAVSLEYLARSAGVGRTNIEALALQFREEWLSRIKAKIILGVLP